VFDFTGLIDSAPRLRGFFVAGEQPQLNFLRLTNYTNLLRMKNFLFVFCLMICTIVYAQDGAFHLDEVYKMSKNGTIDLSSSDAKVFITGSNRPDVHVKIDRKIEAKGVYNYSGDFSVDVEAEGGNLKIREHQSGTMVGVIGYFREDYKIEIEAPEGASLVIHGDDGDYYIKNVNGEISMNIDDADAELAGCKGNKFTFRIDDGDIRMDSGSGSLEVDADDADVSIYHANFSSIYADVDDGDFIIETSLANDGKYSLNSQDGSISMTVTGGGGEFDIRHDDGDVLADSQFKTNEESETRTKVSLANGSARVSMRIDDAKVKLMTARN
jgi:hypothetical protein